MTTPNNGGPAFPKAALDQWSKAIETSGGMKLRDYFAGQALTGHLAKPKRGFMSPAEWAVIAYTMADAMLSERAKRTERGE